MTKTLGSYKLSNRLAIGKERRMVIRALYNLAHFHEVKANSKGALFFKILANVWEVKLNKAGHIEDIFLYGTVLDASRNQGVRW